MMLIPSAVHSADRPAPIPEGWQVILNETFESGIGGNWRVVGSTSDNWGTTTYTSTSPTHSAWSVGSGSLDPALDEYPASRSNWLIYGPLDLSQVWQAYVTFDWWLDTSPGDWLGWCVTTNANPHLSGCDETLLSGPARTWLDGIIPLDMFARSPNPVYLAFHFASNSDTNRGTGAFIDSVVIQGDYGYRTFLPLIRRDPPGYSEDFSGATTWEVVEHTGYDGPPGTGWFSVYNQSGTFRMWLNDRWEHIIASPREMSLAPPYEIVTNIYFYQRSWSSGYGIVFGSPTQNFSGQYYRLLIVYISEGSMQGQLQRCNGSQCDGPVLWGWVSIPLHMANGKEWNTWRVVRDGSHIRIYVNNNQLADVVDSGITGTGYFGLFLSTWEFAPVEIWADYYNVLPHSQS